MALGINGYTGSSFQSLKLNRDDKLEKNEKSRESKFARSLNQTSAFAAKDTFVRSENDPTVGEREGSGYGSGKNNSGAGSQNDNASNAANVNFAASEDVMHMSAQERTNLVNRLQEEQEAQVQQFRNMISKSLGYQASEFTNANATPSVDENGIWHFLASGNYTVDIATKTKAQESISENGYYGVKQTAQRLFKFAMAASGGDTEKMKKLQTGIEDGFRQATNAWGQKLPSICDDTLRTTQKLFDDYYKANGSDGVESAAIGA